MRSRDLLYGLAVAAGVGLAGCHGGADGQAGVPRGRFFGIGVFGAGQLWSKMSVNPPPNASSATTADDEHVIVVVDSQTGELRECGDYSGVCASFNPWTRAIAGQQVAPIKLTKHAADLAAEAHNIPTQGR